MSWKFRKLFNQEFIPLMKFLIHIYQPDIYAEIGIQDGHTFNQISPLIKKTYAVDINPIPKVEHNGNATICKMPSLEFARRWGEKEWEKNKSIDLLFIDGDHRKDSVLADFDALSPFVTPGTGLILLHDTYPSDEYLLKDGWCSNAWEAAEEIHTNQKYKDWEILTLPGPYAGLSILRNVSQGHLHWRE